jgi:hypothetical protein
MPTLHGPALVGGILGAVVFGILALVALSLTPPRLRKPLVATITFLAGLFYATEFFWPVASSGPMAGKNFLTDYIKPVSDGTNVLQAFALGLGVYALVSVHLSNCVRRKRDWGFSALLLGSILAMLIPSLLNSYHPNGYNKGVNSLVFKGAYNALNSTMFSIVAFYIVSAAYRAFRIRSVESTILLTSAFLVMLGQVAIGQALTSHLPTTGFAANGRLENIANWILTKVNSPAVLAVDFGLGIGALATSLRLWLSLERGEYFDQEL